jgi:hypothetical protein
MLVNLSIWMYFMQVITYNRAPHIQLGNNNNDLGIFWPKQLALYFCQNGIEKKRATFLRLI